jgi:hypothetical protein
MAYHIFIYKRPCCDIIVLEYFASLFIKILALISASFSSPFIYRLVLVLRYMVLL